MKNSEEEKSACAKCLSRREVFGVSAQVVLGAAALGFIASCGSSSSSGGSGSGGTTNSTDTNTSTSTTTNTSTNTSTNTTTSGTSGSNSGSTTFDFATYPNLQTTGGSYRVTVNGDPISVTRLTATTATAVLAICTHAGVTLNNASSGTFTCPRHGAVFDTDGTVVSGPVSTNLTAYPATITSTGINVTIS